MKINCNDGCLDNYPGQCVKYTGTQINSPLIPQNSDFNVIVNTLVSSINSISGGINDVYISTPTDVLTISSAVLNASYPNAFLGFSVYFTNITGSPTAVYKFSKYDMTNELWISFQGTKV